MSIYLQGVQNNADYGIREQLFIEVFCLCCVNFLLKCLTVTYSLLVHVYNQQKDLYKISSLVLHTQKTISKYIEGGMRHTTNHILIVEWQHEVRVAKLAKLFINLRKNKD